MTYYARGALITDVQSPRTNWQAFGIYGDHNAYWLSREPTFTPSQLEELDLEYVREQDLPFCLSHDRCYRPRSGPASDPRSANAPGNARSQRGISGRRRTQLPGRAVPGRRTGNY